MKKAKSYKMIYIFIHFRPSISSPQPDVQPERHLSDAGVVATQRHRRPPWSHLQRPVQALRPRAQPLPALRGGSPFPATTSGPDQRHRHRHGVLGARQLHFWDRVPKRSVWHELLSSPGGHHHRQHRSGWWVCIIWILLDVYRYLECNTAIFIRLILPVMHFKVRWGKSKFFYLL